MKKMLGLCFVCSLGYLIALSGLAFPRGDTIVLIEEAKDLGENFDRMLVIRWNEIRSGDLFIQR